MNIDGRLVSRVRLNTRALRIHCFCVLAKVLLKLVTAVTDHPTAMFIIIKSLLSIVMFKKNVYVVVGSVCGVSSFCGVRLRAVVTT